MMVGIRRSAVRIEVFAAAPLSQQADSSPTLKRRGAFGLTQQFTKY